MACIPTYILAYMVAYMLSFMQAHMLTNMLDELDDANPDHLQSIDELTSEMISLADQLEAYQASVTDSQMPTQ